LFDLVLREHCEPQYPRLSIQASARWPHAARRYLTSDRTEVIAAPISRLYDYGFVSWSWPNFGLPAHGEQGILKYTEPQTIAIERGPPVGVPSWMRADHYARVMSSGLWVLRRLPGVK
jgi:hypothetical protein